MKRVHCILLAILMVVCLLPMTTTAASTIWDGSIATAFADGTGTELDPYQVATGEQLAYFAQRVNAGVTYGSKFIVLTDDIVLNDTTNWQSWSDTNAPDNEWTPIGTSLSNLFAGYFDGDNHTISGMYVN